MHFTSRAAVMGGWGTSHRERRAKSLARVRPARKSQMNETSIVRVRVALDVRMPIRGITQFLLAELLGELKTAADPCT
jgi:hypothetical protein